MTNDPAELVWGGHTLRVFSAVSSHGCDPRRIALSVKPHLEAWVRDPGLKFVVNPSRRLLQVLHVTTTGSGCDCHLIDAVNFSGLNLEMDPRKTPAQIDGVLYSADPNPNWPPLFLLCVFDQLRSQGVSCRGAYPLWGGTISATVEVPDEKSVRVVEVLGESFEFLSGADL